MRLAGSKTRSMFDRYNINDSADLSRFAAQLFSVNGKPTASKIMETQDAT